ncbi:MAG: hypothetical protein JNL67_15125 [Planctomycetaceae bacterium]|nr:hypothetical protein [Planctomycetaceae bacterium]
METMPIRPPWYKMLLSKADRDWCPSLHHEQGITKSLCCLSLVHHLLPVIVYQYPD